MVVWALEKVFQPHMARARAVPEKMQLVNCLTALLLCMSLCWASNQPSQENGSSPAAAVAAENSTDESAAFMEHLQQIQGYHRLYQRIQLLERSGADIGSLESTRDLLEEITRTYPNFLGQ